MSLVGELKGLSSANKVQLERLLRKRTKGSDVVDFELAKRLASLSFELQCSLAVLIGRDGRIEYLIVGTKERLYLPPLGRFRLDDSRLRRLRLVVFMPEERLEWISNNNILHSNNEFPVSDDTTPRIRSSKKKNLHKVPKIPADFITDLEKLRLDMVCLVAVHNGSMSSSSVAYLQVSERAQSMRETRVDYLSFPVFLDIELNFSEFIEELERAHRGLQKDKRVKEVRSDRAVLVGVYTGSQSDASYSMDELRELSRTAGVDIADAFVQKRLKIDPKTVLGKGKIEELVLHALDLGADLLIFDCELSPSQLRAITKITELKVLDRSMLILDIFSQHAKSSEGRLQVELAQLKYSLPRLSDRDSGLSRLTGGIGGRGPGETKLEVSRRRVRDRITDLEKKIEILSKQRGIRREKRQLRGVPVVSIVGYTNAGKSTLLNTITKGTVLAENKLFATLDPSSRRMRFPNEKEVVFVDTVGFIRNLPEELLGAFRATLEEVGEADLLLHVVDASQHELRRHIEVVKDTLESLGFEDKERILVLNKSDLLSPPERMTLENALGGISVSASTREGISDLLAKVIDSLGRTFMGSDPGGSLEISGGDL
jgi:GTP-binding protein HflX